MSCRFVDEHFGRGGREDAPELREHAARCQPCAARLHDHACIDAWARKAATREEAPADDLWARIEGATRPAPRPIAPLLWIPVAAAAVAAFCLSIVELEPPSPSGPLLADKEASSIERELAHTEARVRALLDRSPARVEPFSSRLDYLDANLEHSRQLAAANPNNREVQRSLLRTTRSKAHVLEELLNADFRRTDR